MRYVFENERTNIYGIISLKDDGRIEGYYNSNESFWKRDGSLLIFMNKDQKVTTVFEMTEDGEYFSNEKWHYLKPYDKMFPFTEDVQKYKTDKIYHNLIPFYEQKFKYIRKDEIKLIEIGCLGYESIRYWLDYFPNAKIYGIDINNGSFNHERFQFFQANQGDKKRLEEIAGLIGDVDVVIDDGAHTYNETKNVFDAFWPKVKSGGYFVIEDWDWMTDLINEIIQSRGELGGGVKGTRGLKPIDIGIKHLEVSTNDNRAYALFKKR
jgi:hypothetical protein